MRVGAATSDLRLSRSTLTESRGDQSNWITGSRFSPIGIRWSGPRIAKLWTSCCIGCSSLASVLGRVGKVSWNVGNWHV